MGWWWWPFEIVVFEHVVLGALQHRRGSAVVEVVTPPSNNTSRTEVVRGVNHRRKEPYKVRKEARWLTKRLKNAYRNVTWDQYHSMEAEAEACGCHALAYGRGKWALAAPQGETAHCHTCGKSAVDS